MLKPVESESATINLVEGEPSNAAEQQKESSEPMRKSEPEKKAQKPDPMSDAAPNSSFHKSKYFGFMRHKIILAACGLVAGTVLLMSTLDLKQQIVRPVQIDKNLSISDPEPIPELAPNLSYVEESWQKNREFSEGLCPVNELVWESNKIGFVDRTGRVVIKAQFDQVGDFHEGLARVMAGYPHKGPTDSQPGWGFIDKTGRYVIQPKLEAADDFVGGIAPVVFAAGKTVGSRPVAGLIDKQGRTIVKIDDITSSNDIPKRFGDIYLVNTSKGKGVIDKAGNWIQKPGEFEYPSEGQSSPDRFTFGPPGPSMAVEPFYEKCLPFSKGGKVGLLDEQGNVVLPPHRDGELSSFNKGVAKFVHNGQTFFVDSSGKEIFKNRFDSATNYDDIIAVRIEGKTVVIDKTGKQLREIDAACSGNLNKPWLSEGRAAFYVKDKVGYLDSNGDVVIPAKYNYGSPFKNGVANVWDGNYWRLIDRNGNFALPQRFITFELNDAGQMRGEIPGPLEFLTHAKKAEETNYDYRPDNRKIF